jgi:hypothetical protein
MAGAANRLRAFLAFVFVWVLWALPASAQLACPNDTVHSNQIGRYSYHAIERNLGGAGPTCTNQVTIPSDGIRVFSSWVDCRNGHFRLARESGGGFAPNSLDCPNCSATGAAFATLPVGATSDLTAFFTFADNMQARYTATISRSYDGSRYTCSITNAVVAGGVFGGDIDPPTVTLGALSDQGNGTYSAAITLSEPAGNGTAFELADLGLTNATATLSGSGTSFTAVLTPAGQGTIGLSVAAGVFQDAGGNNNTAATQVTTTHDSTAPSLVISGVPAITNAEFTATFTFSEPVTGFAIDDLVLAPNILAQNFNAVSATVYTANIFPSNFATAITIDVPAGAAQDAAGNDNTAAVQAAGAYDGTAPTVTLGALSDQGNGTYSAAITLSEAPGNATAFELADLGLTNATATLSGSGTSFTAVLTPVGQGTIGLDVAAGVFQDTAGNDNQAATGVTAEHDSIAPTVTLGALTLNGDGFYTSAITLSESPGNGTAFEVDDLTVTNASVQLVLNGGAYSAVLQPSGDGTITLNVAAGVFQDAAGNDNTAATGVSVVHDGTRPTIHLGSLVSQGNGTYASTITLSEPAGNGTSFDSTDIFLGNATAVMSGSGTVFNAVLTPLGDGVITLGVYQNSFQDAAGNLARTPDPVSRLHDATAPRVTIAPLVYAGNGTYTTRVTLSEAPANGTAFELADLGLTNATATMVLTNEE